MKLSDWYAEYQSRQDREWYSSYEGVIDDPAVAAWAVDSFVGAVAGAPCVIYGAGLIGAGLSKVLARLGLKVTCFVDREAAQLQTVGGILVRPPEWLRGREGEAELVFLAVSPQTASSVKKDLEDIAPNLVLWDGLAAHIILQSAMCARDLANNTGLPFKDCFDCSILDNSCVVLKKRLMAYNKIDPGALRGTKAQNMIGYILGQVCSLNCRHCCESIPRIARSERRQVPAGMVLDDLKKFASACEFLSIVEFVGGEPFLHPGLPDILSGVLAIKNVGIIHIFTNGTVAPSEELQQVLSDPKIVLYISNYTKALSEKHRKLVERTERILTDVGASFLYGYGKAWFDFSSFDLVCQDEAGLRKKFANCFLGRCHRLHEGLLYQCPHHYGGNVLGVIPGGQDVLPIHDFSDQSLANELDQFADRQYVDACKYCAMPFAAALVKPGIQA